LSLTYFSQHIQQKSVIGVGESATYIVLHRRVEEKEGREDGVIG
jgi:hypothetical protein